MRFLSSRASQVVLDNAKVHVKYNNKDLPSLLTTGIQRLYTAKHRHSFMTERQACNTVLGALHRLRTTSATKAATIADTCDMYVCFALLGYSVRTFTTALDKNFHLHPRKHWRRIAKLILRTQPALP